MGIRSIAGGSRSPVTRVFTSNTTYTPTAGTKWCEVEMVGAGGGSPGGSSILTGVAYSSGGGSGAYIRVFCQGSEIDGKAITVGTASAGNDGGASSIGSVIVAPGGIKGQFYQSGTVSVGYCTSAAGATQTAAPTSSIGSIVVLVPGVGTARSVHMSASANAGFCMIMCSQGGSNPIGAGGVPGSDSVLSSTSGLIGVGYGGGAGGWSCALGGTLAAVAGQPGLVIITEYF